MGEPTWLGTWAQRIKLTIDGSKIEGDLIDFPVLVKISNSSGLTARDVTAVFDELTLSSGTYNLSDYEDDFTGTNGDPPDPNKWEENDATNSLDIQSNKLHFDGEGSGNKISYVVSRFEFNGNSAFDLQADFDLLTWTSPSSNDNYVRFQVGTATTYTWMARQQGSGGSTNRMRLYGNGGTNNSAWNWTGTTGKFRFTWDSSTLKAFVWTGSQWEWNGNTAGYSCSETYNGQEVYVVMLVEQETTGGDVEATFDNFQINSGSAIYDVNRKKVAFTTASGVDQCYAEIDLFDTVNEEAYYWVKVPTLSSGTDVILYFYYDTNQPANSSYIGDVSEIAGRNVWDSNFVMVQHMAQDPTGTMTDSTANATDTTASNAFESGDLIDGLVGKAISADGVAESFDLPTTGTLEVSPFTIEMFVQKDTQGTSSRGLITYLPKGAHNDGRGWQLRTTSDEKPYILKGSADGSWDSANATTVIDNGEYHHIAARFQTSVLLDILVNGIIEDSEPSELSAVVYTDHPSATNPPSKQSRIFCEVDSSGNDSGFADAKIDEIRISNIVRSQAWLKATNHTLRDDLITFNAPQDQHVFSFSGFVQVQGSPAARTVYLFRRSTGELVGSAVSSAIDGSFIIGSPYYEYHFVVILPEVGDGYNLISDDQIHPGI
jgi:hypothetical protein